MINTKHQSNLFSKRLESRNVNNKTKNNEYYQCHPSIERNKECYDNIIYGILSLMKITLNIILFLLSLYYFSIMNKEKLYLIEDFDEHYFNYSLFPILATIEIIINAFICIYNKIYIEHENISLSLSDTIDNDISLEYINKLYKYNNLKVDNNLYYNKRKRSGKEKNIRISKSQMNKKINSHKIENDSNIDIDNDSDNGNTWNLMKSLIKTIKKYDINYNKILLKLMRFITNNNNNKFNLNRRTLLLKYYRCYYLRYQSFYQEIHKKISSLNRIVFNANANANTEIKQNKSGSIARTKKNVMYDEKSNKPNYKYNNKYSNSNKKQLSDNLYTDNNCRNEFSFDWNYYKAYLLENSKNNKICYNNSKDDISKANNQYDLFLNKAIKRILNISFINSNFNLDFNIEKNINRILDYSFYMTNNLNIDICNKISTFNKELLVSLITNLKYKYLPKNHFIKKQCSILHDVIIIEKGSVEVIVNNDFTEIEIISVNDYIADFNCKLNNVILRLSKSSTKLLYIKNSIFKNILKECINKFLDLIEFNNIVKNILQNRDKLESIVNNDKDKEENNCDEIKKKDDWEIKETSLCSINPIKPPNNLIKFMDSNNSNSICNDNDKINDHSNDNVISRIINAILNNNSSSLNNNRSKGNKSKTINIDSNIILKSIENSLNTLNLLAKSSNSLCEIRLYLNKDYCISYFNNLILDSFEKNSLVIQKIAKKYIKISKIGKKKHASLNRKHLSDLRYFFKEDFQNILYQCSYFIDSYSVITHFTIINLNNYNNPERNNIISISETSSYQIDPSYTKNNEVIGNKSRINDIYEVNDNDDDVI